MPLGGRLDLWDALQARIWRRVRTAGRILATHVRWLPGPGPGGPTTSVEPSSTASRPGRPTATVATPTISLRTAVRRAWFAGRRTSRCAVGSSTADPWQVHAGDLREEPSRDVSPCEARDHRHGGFANPCRARFVGRVLRPGSPAGCSAAIPSTREGHRVDVFERSKHGLVGRGGGIGTPGSVSAALPEREMESGTPLGSSLPRISYGEIGGDLATNFVPDQDGRTEIGERAPTGRPPFRSQPRTSMRSRSTGKRWRTWARPPPGTMRLDEALRRWDRQRSTSTAGCWRSAIRWSRPSSGTDSTWRPRPRTKRRRGGAQACRSRRSSPTKRRTRVPDAGFACVARPGSALGHRPSAEHPPVWPRARLSDSIDAKPPRRRGGSS